MIYFIRHAQSSFNYEADDKLKKQMGAQFSKKSQQYLQLKFHPKFADCGLTQNGKQQCLVTKQKLQNIQINLVLVSPMRRALQTCDIIFKDHKNKPKIIVDPGVRQIFSSSCDIGTRLREGLKDFEYFDFSQIKNIDYWYIDSIKNMEVKKILLQRLYKEIQLQNINLNGIQNTQNHQKVNKLSFKIMLEYLKQNLGKINQKTLSNFQDQKIKMKKLAQQYKNIAVVSHHDNIVAYTKKPTKNAQALIISADQL